MPFILGLKFWRCNWLLEMICADFLAGASFGWVRAEGEELEEG
jgi:hypothetical protein